MGNKKGDKTVSFFKKLRKLIVLLGAMVLLVIFMFIEKGSINIINNIMFFIIVLCVMGDIGILIYCKIKGIKLFKVGRRKKGRQKDNEN